LLSVGGWPLADAAKKYKTLHPYPPPSRKPAHHPRIRAVIKRDQVLHVARLARLRLSDEEVETMVGELSGILEHVDRIGKLDLEGVEPTSHVVALENVLRADEPRPSWPRERILEQAPDPIDGAFRVPSPQADA
jgi:aspartyl-tRNA(Asn)/glutamyl-tRNA(Gln) amidotransferase subunit C